MRRNRSSTASAYRALAHHPAGVAVPDSASLIRSFNDMPLDLLDRMRSFPLFMSAPEEFLVAIGKHLRPQVHSPHDHVLTEGDEAKAMYWLVRGVVAVTSRDGEAIHAELKPGAFFGEIGVLMDMPRTATIIARTKCLLLVLKKEDLQLELPRFPDMEKAIRHEAHERLTILKKKRQEGSHTRKHMVSREAAPGEVATGDMGAIKEGAVVNHKKRKSPSPGVIEDPAASALGSGALPKTYKPFTEIVQQGSPGNEIYFIVRGEAEVIHDGPKKETQTRRVTRSSYIRPRLRAGQYFGEVSSLGLSRRRTATVRSITTVECLMIGGDALDELWKRCPPGIRKQVEDTARTRIKPTDEDVEMVDVAKLDRPDTPTTPIKIPQQAIFSHPSLPVSPAKDDSDPILSKDPDPFLSVDMENMRNRRRGSFAPPTPPADSPCTPPVSNGIRHRTIEVSTPIKYGIPSSPDSEGPSKKARILPRRPASMEQSLLPEDVLVSIFQWMDLPELTRLRIVSTRWRKLLATSPRLCTVVDLTPHNRRVTDHVLVKILAPFFGPRPRSVDLSNCFHVTDEGFSALWKMCGKNIKIWKMKSVWDVSANQILDMSEHAKGLEEVDWSNCRKVGDNLLARVVGWVVPEHAQATKQVVISNSRVRGGKPVTQTVTLPPPGTVVGCPKLKRLNLSYCKHITDRSMAHLAAHASNRIESLSLTRCTSITDAGFQTWTPYRFANLTRLCLADCTYLSDNAIIALANSAKALTHLDLSFCCALSDTATEVVALGLPKLQELKMAFCGSAVSDNSLACIALHLTDLERLSVRGCVRVTAMGIESVLDGCAQLEWCDVSQCRNLEPWVNGGGVTRWGYDERGRPQGKNGAKRPSIMPPRGVKNRRARQPVGFVVEKGPYGLR
ncbi:uncharacterized protein PG986_002368 [Apiospora aurea]|uniref:Cyclic nucleotide-binding domain-containing protein n=1 Tax=Apiospora aurea TaxID=335848 RepID=A0ABR1QZE8_9PEZI